MQQQRQAALPRRPSRAQRRQPLHLLHHRAAGQRWFQTLEGLPPLPAPVLPAQAPAQAQVQDQQARLQVTRLVRHCDQCSRRCSRPLSFCELSLTGHCRCCETAAGSAPLQQQQQQPVMAPWRAVPVVAIDHPHLHLDLHLQRQRRVMQAPCVCRQIWRLCGHSWLLLWLSARVAGRTFVLRQQLPLLPQQRSPRQAKQMLMRLQARLSSSSSR